MKQRGKEPKDCSTLEAKGFLEGDVVDIIECLASDRGFGRPGLDQSRNYWRRRRWRCQRKKEPPSSIERQQEKAWVWVESPDAQYSFWKGAGRPEGVRPGEEVEVVASELGKLTLIAVLVSDVTARGLSAKWDVRMRGGLGEVHSCGADWRAGCKFGGDDCQGHFRA